SVFFSRRRRHTRCYRDWSSDVCSSDLSIRRAAIRYNIPCITTLSAAFAAARGIRALHEHVFEVAALQDLHGYRAAAHGQPSSAEIGRASCRERVEVSASAASVEERGQR